MTKQDEARRQILTTCADIVVTPADLAMACGYFSQSDHYKSIPHIDSSDAVLFFRRLVARAQAQAVARTLGLEKAA